MRIVAAIRVLALAAAAVGCVAGGIASVRLALADSAFRRETPEGTQKAIAYEPGCAEYSVRLALLVGDDDPRLAFAALRQAVQINPNNSRAWIELGLRYESEKHFRAAETALLTAADVDKMYEPRWSLMNYYFRRRQNEQFWAWAKAAVPMIYGDPLPLFHLCGRVEEDGRLVDRLQIRKIGLQAAYLFYLLDIGRADLAGDASRRLIEGNRASDVPLLLDACDRLIEARRTDDALAIWNGLTQRNRLPFGPKSDSLLTNGDFAVSPTGHGFDWRIPTVEGIAAAREENPTGLRLTFSGSEPEQAEALAEVVPVSPDHSYELSFHYRTHQVNTGTGLQFRIADGDTGRILKASEDLASEETADRALSFVTPGDCRMARVAVTYQRRPGTTRIAGYLVLRQVSLKPLPE